MTIDQSQSIRNIVQRWSIMTATSGHTYKSNLAEDLEQHYSVIGIAFLVEEAGRESRLVVRYPVSKPSITSLSDGDNVFYSLSPRVMAKLFRPKPALCNMPTTISVGETVFCCQTVPVADEVDHDDDIGVSNLESNDNTSGELVVFSIIIALKKSRDQDYMDSGGSILQFSSSLSSSQSIFQNVHLTLRRVCDAFEREEKRCGYLSSQIKSLDNIIEENKSTGVLPNESNIDRSDVDVNGRYSTTRTILDGNTTQDTHDEVLQTIWELQVTNDQNQSGNLARELAECYHALSKNHHEFHSSGPRQGSLINNGIVFINGHIAVPIVPITASPLSYSTSLRPENTLLFTNSSSVEVNLAMSPKPLQRVINRLSPTKSLEDVANELSIPIELVMEFCSYFVDCGSAIAVPTLSQSSRYGCSDTAIQKMKQIALKFSQQFGITIYAAVGLVVSGNTLGSIVSSLKANKRLRDKLLVGYSSDRNNGLSEITIDSGDFVDIEKVLLRYVIWLRAHGVILEIVEFVVAMNIYDQMNKFYQDDISSTRRVADKQQELTYNLSRTHQLSTKNDNQSLFEELVKVKLLSGQLSKPLLRYKLGFDQKRFDDFIHWGITNKKLTIVERMPTPDDVI